MSDTRVHAPVFAALTVAAPLAACGEAKNDSTPTAAKAAKATAELPQGRIAFRRWLDYDQTHGAIFTVGTDGTAEQQVTDPDPGWTDDFPDWSPDGRLIAFQHCPSPPNYDHGPCSIWTVDAEGGAPHKVDFQCRRGACDSSGPAWTPDGRLIATHRTGRVREFDGESLVEQAALEVIDLRSGHHETIHKRTGWTGGMENPQVSRDGRTVVYARLNSVRSKPVEGAALFAVGIDGSGDHQVASWELGGGDHASFSPGGEILFRSFENDDSKQSDYWTVRPDGTGLKQLTHFKIGTRVLKASYSPDGDWIVYGSDYGHGKADLYVMRADGSDRRQLTHSEWWDSAPDWGPTPH
jgi:TolB protein